MFLFVFDGAKFRSGENSKSQFLISVKLMVATFNLLQIRKCWCQLYFSLICILVSLVY